MVHYRIHPEDNKKLRRQDAFLYDDLLEILDTYDLAGIGEGRPADEYALEAGTILPRLKEAKSAEDVTGILHQEFVKFFGLNIAVPASRYQDAGAEIWEAWQRHRRRNPAPIADTRGRWNKSKVELPDGFPEPLLRASLPITSIQRLAWRADDAVKVVEFLTDAGYEISGEVYRLRTSWEAGRSEQCYWSAPNQDLDSWQTTYSRDEQSRIVKHVRYEPQLTWQEQVAASKRETMEYVENFRKRNGEEYCYVLWWTSEEDNERRMSEEEKTVDEIVEGSLIESLRARLWLRKHPHE